ncbi:Mu transposase C-terminal domain-containing protein [Pseudomonas violetae]|uniref:Mu transposase C-terminal domain-containing protein n=1 Tax=Pseudomonas violetae TaxID=2915813 RepID=A0ABT0EZL2_9PSED|nr:Mu transposase C-terminal domain-containing protein [Pseudomonas violetae]MCK1791197.1 Mu transposase C-terminal domain-containing protein [Pseudomonas violetae]
MRNWYTTQELAGLPGLPGTVPGVRKVAVRLEWESRKRLASKAIEYSFSCLPPEAQSALLAKAVSEVEAPKESVSSALIEIPKERDAKNTSRLNDIQREVMLARLAFIREIERMSVHVSQRAAIDLLVKHAQDAALSPYLMERVDLANDRKTGGRALSERTLKRWLSAFRSEGEAGLAPLRQRPNMEMPAWTKDFLRCYQRPTKPSVAASYAEFIGKYEGSIPSIHAVQRFLKKLSPEALQAGRMTPQELKSLQPFRRRTTKNMFPGDVYTADGHKFDAEVINPITGKPYRPEITTVLDVATRRVVGVSVGEAESAIGVLDALRDAIRKCMFGIFYVDNGSGFDNDMVREVVDRLGGTMQHSIPYNSQARGVSERGHQTIWVRAAKKLTSYIGADMDKHAGTKVHRVGRKQLKEFGTTKLMPTFGEFMAGVEDEIVTYNSTPHRGLEKFRDPLTGVMRHPSPDEAWQMAIDQGWEPLVATPELVETLMRPQVVRKTHRGEIQWLNNIYFLDDLRSLHGQEIRLAYDVRDAARIWAYALDGELIGEALLDGNASDYMPMSLLERSREKRQQGQVKRSMDKLETLTGHRVEMIAPTTRRSATLSHEALTLAQEFAQTLEAEQPQFVVPGDDVARYRLWIKLDERVSSGGELSAEETRWWELYPSHPDFKAMKEVFQRAG